MGSERRAGSVGEWGAGDEHALSWASPRDGGDGGSGRDGVEEADGDGGAGLDGEARTAGGVPDLADDDWYLLDLDILDLTASRREGLRVGARLLAFAGLGLAVAVTGWINIAGYGAPGVASHPVRELVMWAFAINGSLLVAVSLVLLTMAVIEAKPWSRRRRPGV